MTNAVLGGIFNFFVIITNALLEFTSNFFMAVFGNEKMKVIIGNMEGKFKEIWRVFRDIGNMFIALGFVICGIGTALRIKEYEAKKMIIPLLLIAIFMNFTYHPLWTIVRASESITGALATAAGAGTINPVIHISNIWAGAASMRTFDFLVRNSMLLFISIMWSMLYFTFAMLFIIRYSAFGFLIVVAPLAFACLALGFTQDIWKKWFSQFMTWCLMGIFLAGAVYISNQFYSIVRTINLGLPADLANFDTVIKDLFPLSALIIGFYLSGAGSLVGAKMITSGVVGIGVATAGMAAGGLAKAGGGIAGATGAAGSKLSGVGGATGAIARGAGFKPSGKAPGGALAGAPGGVKGAGTATAEKSKPTLFDASGRPITPSASPEGSTPSPEGSTPSPKGLISAMKRAGTKAGRRIRHPGKTFTAISRAAGGPAKGGKAVATGLGVSAANIIAGTARIITPVAKIGTNVGKSALRELSSQIVGAGKGVPGLGGKS